MTDRVTLGVQFDPDSELLEDFEEYKESNGFTSRAETMRHLMREQLHDDSGVWETVSQQALYAVTFSLIVAAISTASFVTAFVVASFPSPETVVTFAFLIGSLFTAVGSGLTHRYSTARARRVSTEAEA